MRPIETPVSWSLELSNMTQEASVFSLNKPYLGVGAKSSRLGMGLMAQRIGVESRDGEAG